MKKLLPPIAIAILVSACSDDFEIPNRLNFEEVTEFDTWGVQNAPGLLASEDLNSLFFASREPNPETFLLNERLLRYDVSNDEVVSDFADLTDFVSKEIHITGDNITVIGGQYITTYDLNFDQEPESVLHGLQLSRFGSTLYNDDIYIWGGDLQDIDSDKIKRWNSSTSSFETVGELPARKAGAHGEVIDDKLYIFGGQEHWQLEPPNDVIFIYDFIEGTVETTFLPTPVFRTFTDVYEGRIFIAGQIADNDPITQDLDIFFAVFNPKNNSIKEVDVSLSDAEFQTIHQMAILNKSLYVLYGDVNDDPGTIRLMEHRL